MLLSTTYNGQVLKLLTVTQFLIVLLLEFCINNHLNLYTVHQREYCQKFGEGQKIIGYYQKMQNSGVYIFILLSYSEHNHTGLAEKSA